MSDLQNEFGMIGLGTMGRNLLLNMADHGFKVSGYDLDAAKVDELKNVGHANVFQTTDIGAFVASIRLPRALMMLVPAGKPVDSVIESFHPLLAKGDFLIDGGNSHYIDTKRRIADLEKSGLGFMGMGISGGESGARYGPSMMPGGREQDYDRVKAVLEAIAAKYDKAPCVSLVGSGAAGHYVKMVHNGIEYAAMQIIAEVYDLMIRGLNLSTSQAADLFARWNSGHMKSYLLEITPAVLRYREEGDPTPLVLHISDRAESKGTGKWTSQDAMDLGIPIPSIDAAVSARELSGYADVRKECVTRFATTANEDLYCTAEELSGALICGILLAYSQGFALIHSASAEYGFRTDLATAATIWRAGCIIRSGWLEVIRRAFESEPNLEHLLFDPDFSGYVQSSVPALRKSVQSAQKIGLPVPALSASLGYFDGLRSKHLPANLIQAQRDCFGAHTYERDDKPGVFHTEWMPES